MKTILYMAMSLNGNIATHDDKTTWTSKEDWEGFLAMAKSVGNIVIGKRTYEMAKKENVLQDNKFRVVMTHHPETETNTDSTIFTAQSPKEILAMIERKGFPVAMVAGGGQINSAFLKAGLIDEIYIDIEPLIIGRGIPLFAPDDFQVTLQLIDLKKLNEHTIQLHYSVYN